MSQREKPKPPGLDWRPSFPLPQREGLGRLAYSRRKLREPLLRHPNEPAEQRKKRASDRNPDPYRHRCPLGRRFPRQGAVLPRTTKDAHAARILRVRQTRNR